MPDQTVTVTFTQQGNAFTFSPPSVTMTAAGKIVFNRGGNPEWTFVGAVVKNDTLNEFTVQPNPGGQTMQINDSFMDRSRKAYQYNVTIKPANGSNVTSPDPEIVNDPPIKTP